MNIKDNKELLRVYSKIQVYLKYILGLILLYICIFMVCEGTLINPLTFFADNDPVELSLDEMTYCEFENIDGTLVSMSSDPNLICVIEGEKQYLVIDVEYLDCASTQAKVYYTIEEMEEYWKGSYSENNSVEVTLVEGSNFINLGTTDYTSLRLDLTNSEGVSMELNSITLSNHYGCTLQLGIILVGLFLMYTGCYIKRKSLYVFYEKHMGAEEGYEIRESKSKIAPNKVKWITLSILSICYFIIQLRYLNSNYLPVSYPDSYGYLANAAYMLGNNWGTNITPTLYYNFGYSIFILPFFMIFDYGTQIMQAITVENALLSVLSIWLSYKIIMESYKKEGHRIHWVATVACALMAVNYSYLVHNTSSRPEVLANTLYLVVVLIVIWIVKGKREFLAVSCLALVNMYLYLVHQRFLVVVIASTMLVIYLFCIKRLKIRSVVAFFGIIGLGLVVNEYGKGILMDTLYANVDLESLEKNDFSGIVSALLDFDLIYIVNMITILLGQVYYLGISTFLIGFYFIYDCGEIIVRLFKKKVMSNEEILKIFVFVSWLGVTALTALFLAQYDDLSSRRVFFGRYSQCVIAVMFILGFIQLYRDVREQKSNLVFRAKLIIGAIVANCICLQIIYSNYGISYAVHHCSPATFWMYYWYDGIYNGVIFALVPIVLFGSILFAFSCCRKSRWMLLLFLPLILICYLNENNFASQFEQPQQAQFETVSAAVLEMEFDEANGVYGVGDSGTVTTEMMMQTLFPKEVIQIHTIEAFYEQVELLSGDVVIDFGKVLSDEDKSDMEYMGTANGVNMYQVK